MEKMSTWRIISITFCINWARCARTIVCSLSQLIFCRFVQREIIRAFSNSFFLFLFCLLWFTRENSIWFLTMAKSYCRSGVQDDATKIFQPNWVEENGWKVQQCCLCGGHWRRHPSSGSRTSANRKCVIFKIIKYIHPSCSSAQRSWQSTLSVHIHL